MKSPNSPSLFFLRLVASLAPRAGSLAAIVVFAALLALIAYGARASDNAQPPAAPAPGTPPTVKVIIHYLGKTYDEPVPLSLVDQVITDNGLAGARIAIQDNNKSGQFLGQEYDLVEDIPPADGDVVAKAKEILKDGPAIIIADLEAKDLLGVADLPEAKGSIIFNIRLSEDVLRGGESASTSSTSRRAHRCAPTRSRNTSSGRNGPNGSC